MSTGSVRSVLGDEIRKARLAAGLTQEGLAEKAGVSRNYISLLELNRQSPTIKKFFDICRTLDLRPSTLIARVERRRT